MDTDTSIDLGRLVVRSPIMSVAGHELRFDPDDVESVNFNLAHDVIDDTPEGATSARWKLGAQHLKLDITFKPGKSARWEREEG
jgi:hypothetical protein